MKAHPERADGDIETEWEKNYGDEKDNWRKSARTARAARKTGRATRKTGRKVARAARKTGRATRKTGRKVARAARKTGRATRKTGRKAACRKTGRATRKTGRRWHAARKTARKPRLLKANLGQKEAEQQRLSQEQMSHMKGGI